MAMPTAEEIVCLYLYEQTTPPAVDVEAATDARIANDGRTEYFSCGGTPTNGERRMVA